MRKLILIFALCCPAALWSAEPSLQRLVMLCAVQPGSAEFDASWVAWVQQHPDADLKRTIDEVISRAGTVRSMSQAGIEPGAPARRPDSEAIAERMRHLARRAEQTPTPVTAPSRSD